MNRKWGLIYFIHDDLSREFSLNTIPNILNAPVISFLKVFLVHNKREPFIGSGRRQLVTYQTEISELIKKENKTSLNLLKKTDSWKKGFEFVIEQIKELDISQTGVITLSHAAGLIINRNGEDVPIVGVRVWIRNLIAKIKNRKKYFQKSYFRAKAGKGRLYISSKTVVDKPFSEINTDKPVELFESKYTRGSEFSYCRRYEGLFTYDVSNFFGGLTKKFDFVIFSNCDIQLYDTGFLFAPITDFMVGAQSNNNRTIWDFPLIVETIQNSPDSTPPELIEKIFDQCINRFSTEEEDDGYHYFLTRTMDFALLHSKFEIIIEHIRSEIMENQQFKLAILAWLKNTSNKPTSQYHPFFDVMSFFQMANKISSRNFDPTLAEFKDILENHIIIKRKSDDQRCGFSLYLPRDKKSFEEIKGPQCNYFNPGNINAFAKSSKFDDLLISLFQ